jgi:predicted nucleotidyltransferase
MANTVKANRQIGQLLREIVEKIKVGYQPEKIILYGSYAYGHPDDESDIDLLIVKETDASPFDRRVAVRRIVDLRLPIAFAPIVVTPRELAERLEMADSFFEEILQKGKTLYAKEGITDTGRLVRKG